MLAYGGLGFPLAVLNLPLYVYLPTFYAEQIGLGLATVGLMLFVARLLDTLSDPLIGELSDRLPTRFGRRRPWLVAACPVLLLGTWMLFVPQAGADAGYLLLWTSIAYIAWTMMLLPYTAWGAELSGAYDERSRITSVREGFVILGILCATGGPALLGIEAGEQDRTLRLLATSMLVLLPLSLLFLLGRCPSRRRARAAAAVAPRLAGGAANRPFMRLVGAFFLNGIANGLPATLFLLFVADVLGSPARAGPLLLLYFVAAVAGVPLWLRVSYRIGKHRAWAASMLWACLVFVWVPLLGPGDFWPFLVICCLSGLSLGADLALPASIQADVVDLDRLESGRRRTGLFFAAWSMVSKLSLALAVGIAFPVLDLIGFEAGGQNSGPPCSGLQPSMDCCRSRSSWRPPPWSGIFRSAPPAMTRSAAAWRHRVP